MDPESPPHIGIVTGECVPQLTEDGQTVKRQLSDRGYEVSGVVWSDTTVDWSSFEALVVRSCWEYYQRPEQFQAWLDMVDSDVHAVINPVDVIKWNLHKSYLRELDTAGVAVTPTAYVKQGRNESLADICERNNWEQVVVKPAIGTSSDGVWQATTPISEAANERFRNAVANTDVLVQQFVPDIANGELSMVFFTGEFSHATRTIPDAGEFRAHHRFGASTNAVTPTETIREIGKEILGTASEIHGFDPADLTYARVDGVTGDDSFVLLELELIEPYLRLSASDGAVERFVDAIERNLSTQFTLTGNR